METFIFLAVPMAVLFAQGYAGKANVNTGACEFDKYNDDHQLKSIDRIRGLIGKSYQTDGLQDNWHFTIGICTNLQIDGALPDSGAIQYKTKDGKPDPDDKVKHNIGSLKDTHLMAGSDWALLEYKSGENYKSHCGNEGKRTSILLSCDETVDDGDAKMVYIEEESNKGQDCYYLFEMKHQAVCPKSTSTSVLSVGSILLITFFTVLSLYLLVGFLYQRFVLGSKGLEQIPNYEFWKDLGNLEADGCNFVCRSGNGRQNTGFRGIGDDQLDVTEEIRDDNLLPM